MRRALMWAGNWILFGLWLLTWPRAMWRWSAAYPLAERKPLRQYCAFGALFMAGICLTTLISLDFSWIYHAMIFYIPWGLRAVRMGDMLVRRCESLKLLEKPSDDG